MKEKILSALKTKFKNLGFGDKAFSGVAEYLAATVTEEDQIETAIGGVESLLKAFQGDIDNRVNTAVAKAKAEKGGDQSQPEKQETTDDEKVPSWAQTLISKVSSLESQKKEETLAQKWAKAVSDKGIKNDKLRDRWLPKTEDEFEDNLNDLVEFNKTISIQEANGNSTGRPAGSTSSGSVSKETQSKIDGWKSTKADPVEKTS